MLMILEKMVPASDQVLLQSAGCGVVMDELGQ